MKIKKQMTVKAKAVGGPTKGAAIADRLKLEPIAAKASSKSSSSVFTIITIFVALLALGVAGTLGWYLYEYNEYMTAVVAK